jgi:DNA-binding MarR family transcriptional regulator
MIALGYPEKEGYIERRTDQKAQPGDYLQFRLTDKGLEFINETG